MVWTGVGLSEYCQHVGKCLPDLADEVVGFELAVRVPADLASHRDHDPACRNAVDIAPRKRPTRRLQNFIRQCRTFQSSGNNTTSSIFRRYATPLVPPVPVLNPIIRSTV